MVLDLEKMGLQKSSLVRSSVVAGILLHVELLTSSEIFATNYFSHPSARIKAKATLIRIR